VLSAPRTIRSAYARTALIVRTTATVYNYDYIYNYVFHMDGAIEVAAAASGYLQARSDRDCHHYVLHMYQQQQKHVKQHQQCLAFSLPQML
jgi:Cu2+-containing amine oxidase